MVEIVYRREQTASFFLSRQEILDALKKCCRTDLGQYGPIYSLRNDYLQLFDAKTLFRAGLIITIKAHFAYHSLNAGATDAYAAAIHACSYQKLLQRQRATALGLLGYTQGAFPVLNARKGIGLTAPIKDNKGNGDLAEVKLMNKSISWLTGQIPQQRFACLLTALSQVNRSALKWPDTAGMGGIRECKWLLRKHQARFADATITDKDNSGIGILGLGSVRSFSKDDIKV